MRLRNITGSAEIIKKSRWVVHEPENCKGHWADVFGNNHKLAIEVGMGKGRFIMDMAAAHPDVNYVGIEMYDSVLLRAVQKAEERTGEGMSVQRSTGHLDGGMSVQRSTGHLDGGTSFRPNFRFICMDARRLADIFAPGEVDRIYLNFSDPWPKDRHAKRRLTSRQFLSVYRQILRSGHTLEFKTDNADLFDFSLAEIDPAGWKLIASTRDLHRDEEMNRGNIMTEYEEKFSLRGNPIYKLISTYERS